MTLQLQNHNGEVISELNDDARTLMGVGARDGFCLHCIDPTLKARMGEFEDVSQVEKFVISEEDYDKRHDNFRKFREKQIASNPNYR